MHDALRTTRGQECRYRRDGGVLRVHQIDLFRLDGATPGDDFTRMNYDGSIRKVACIEAKLCFHPRMKLSCEWGSSAVRP